MGFSFGGLWKKATKKAKGAWNWGAKQVETRTGVDLPGGMPKQDVATAFLTNIPILGPFVIAPMLKIGKWLVWGSIIASAIILIILIIVIILLVRRRMKKKKEESRRGRR
jgi:protein-S-isoprenylcysteine O-methyltransferase Ste14